MGARRQLLRRRPRGLVGDAELFFHLPRWPCALIAARQIVEGREVVTVVPVTHTPPAGPGDAVEIPAALNPHLGPDDMPS